VAHIVNHSEFQLSQRKSKGKLIAGVRLSRNDVTREKWYGVVFLVDSFFV